VQHRQVLLETDLGRSHGPHLQQSRVDPPLQVDAAGSSVPELCIGVALGRRSAGIGGMMLDALFARCAETMDAMCTNVHVRNPAQHLYQRKGFQVVGQGRGPHGLAMRKDLRSW